MTGDPDSPRFPYLNADLIRRCIVLCSHNTVVAQASYILKLGDAGSVSLKGFLSV